MTDYSTINLVTLRPWVGGHDTGESPVIFRGIRMKDFPTCTGSSTAWDQCTTCDYHRTSYCLPLRLTTSASQSPDFAAQWLACRFPLSTLRHTPHGAYRMTRGQSDSPFLLRIELSSTIFHRLCSRTKRPALPSIFI